MLDCGHHGNTFVQSPTGLLTKARQQFNDPIWYIYHVQDHYKDTAKDWASTFRKEDHKEENQGGYLVPPVDHYVSELGKQRWKPQTATS